MEATIQRVQASFSLRKDVLERLEHAARECRCSLDSYVEAVLLDDVYFEPNEETLEAMNEVREGKCENNVLDTSSREDLRKTLFE